MEFPRGRIGTVLRASALAALWMLASCSGKENAAAPAGVPTVVDSIGGLRVSGTRIVGKNNTGVALHGMSLYWSQWGGSFYNAQCVGWLADDWKCSVVRAACAVESGGYLTSPQTELLKVEAVIDACIARGIYVIVDWHDSHAEDHLAQAKIFFAAIGQKYGSAPNIIYEIYNEPLAVSWSGVIKPYAAEVTKVIRQYAPAALIVVGTPNWSQDVDTAAKDPVADTNTAYSLHFYTGTHRQSLRDKATAAISGGIALFVTEYGISEASGNGVIDWAETDRWFAFVQANALSTCDWSVSDKNETSAALVAGASPLGQWKSSDLSVSGEYIRGRLRALNASLP